MTEPSREYSFRGFGSSELPPGFDFCSGKVRDVFDLDDELLIVASDRNSAFDLILGDVPFKGEVLNRLSASWFQNTADVVDNHFIATVSPRAMLVRKCRVIPVEVVVRAYLIGETWNEYLGTQSVAGVELPDDLCHGDRLEEPVLIPSVRENDGLHNRCVSRDEVIYSGAVDAELWEKMEQKARDLFSVGTVRAEERGLLLVESRYQFGMRGDEMLLVDELHTPDSSDFRYQVEDRARFGETDTGLAGPFVRNWLLDHGYTGEGHPPEIPDEVFLEESRLYQKSFEALTGNEFRTQSAGIEAEKEKLLSFIEDRQEEN